MRHQLPNWSENIKKMLVHNLADLNTETRRIPLKGTVSVISNDTLCKYGRFT